MALWTTIPMMELVKELKTVRFKMCSTKPTMHCRVSEDSSGALVISKVQKMRPRTKHINIKYHHFRDFVDRGEISLHAINTKDQPADMLTKPLNKAVLSSTKSSSWAGALERLAMRGSVKKPAICQVKIIASLNLAPEVKLEIFRFK